VVYDLAAFQQAQAITVGGTTFYSLSPNPIAAGYLDSNPATPFTYTQATSNNVEAPTPLSNYVLFTGLTGGSQTVSVQSPTGLGFRSVRGFQIVETVPEPSAALLLLGGCGWFGCCRRRRPTWF
jgi:hypothetical protein